MNALHPADRDHAIEALNYLHEHASPDSHFLKAGEGRHLRPDGTINWFYSQVVQEFDDAGNLIGFVGTLTDISDRKTMEIALKESERRYASLAAAAPVAIFRFDTPMHCVYVNERWSALSGRPRESALGYGWMEALHPDDRGWCITFVDRIRIR